MNAIDELRCMNLQDLYEKMRFSNHDCLESMSLLLTFHVCDFCGDHMKPDGRSRTWICHKRDCLRAAGEKKPPKGLLVGTFFEESRISHKNVFLFSYFWAQQLGTMEKWSSKRRSRMSVCMGTKSSERYVTDISKCILLSVGTTYMSK